MERNMRPKAYAGIASSEIGDLLWKAFLKLAVASIETEKPGTQPKKMKETYLYILNCPQARRGKWGEREEKESYLEPNRSLLSCP